MHLFITLLLIALSDLPNETEAIRGKAAKERGCSLLLGNVGDRLDCKDHLKIVLPLKTLGCSAPSQLCWFSSISVFRMDSP